MRSLLASPASLTALKALLGVRTHPALPEPLPLPSEHTAQADPVGAEEEARGPGPAEGWRAPARCAASRAAHSRAASPAGQQASGSSSPCVQAPAPPQQPPPAPCTWAPDAPAQEPDKLEPIDPPCYTLARQVVDGGARRCPRLSPQRLCAPATPPRLPALALPLRRMLEGQHDAGGC
jgi:hypothetical protein